MADIKITEIGATREEATRLGLLIYYGPKPCRQHHIPTMRYTKTGHCLLCVTERGAEWRAANRERKSATDREYHDRPEVKARQYEAVKAKRAANPQARRDSDNAHYAEHPEVFIARTARWEA